MKEIMALSNNPEVLLAGFSTCPFVHRVRFLLEEIGYPYKIKYVNPYVEKPAWLLNMSPSGKVPAIEIENKSLCESGVIMEYFNDICDGKLLPEDKWQRAQHRILITRAEEILGCLWQLYTVKESKLFEDAVKRMCELYTNLDQTLQTDYRQLIEQANLISCVYAPILYKSVLITEYSGYEVFPDIKGLLEWRDSLLSRESFQNTIPADYNENSKKFICKQNSVLANMLENESIAS